jgi:hypothetical protein
MGLSSCGNSGGRCFNTNVLTTSSFKEMSCEWLVILFLSS